MELSIDKNVLLPFVPPLLIFNPIGPLELISSNLACPSVPIVAPINTEVPVSYIKLLDKAVAPVNLAT